MSLIRRAALGLLLTAACAITPAGAAAADDGVAACAVTYRTLSHPGGFTALIAIQNTGTVTIYGWTLSFPLDEGVEVIGAVDAELTSPSGQISAENRPYNGVVDPGRSISIAFKAKGTAATAPARFTVNEINCVIA